MDDGAIATDKTALLPGGTATFANYTSFSRGINGIVVDIQNLANAGALSAADFSFKVGNDNNPVAWTAATAPLSVTVLAGTGTGGSDRAIIIWGDNAIQNQWLQVAVLANANTGLAANDVFYFGNAIGESGNNTAGAIVDAQDESLALSNKSGFSAVAITNAYDHNRDGRVTVADVLVARHNHTDGVGDNPLQLIAAPSLGAPMAAQNTLLLVPSPTAVSPLIETANSQQEVASIPSSNLETQSSDNVLSENAVTYSLLFSTNVENVDRTLRVRNNRHADLTDSIISATVSVNEQSKRKVTNENRLYDAIFARSIASRLLAAGNNIRPIGFGRYGFAVNQPPCREAGQIAEQSNRCHIRLAAQYEIEKYFSCFGHFKGVFLVMRRIVSITKTIALVSLIYFFTTATQAEIVVYPIPDGIPHNDDFTVKVRESGGEWRDLFEYAVKVDLHNPRTSSIVIFDFSGAVEISVTSNQKPIQIR